MDWVRGNGMRLNSSLPSDRLLHVHGDSPIVPVEPVPEEPDSEFKTPARELPRRLLLKTGRRAFFLAAEAIRWIQADGSFVLVHTAGRSYRARGTISALFKRLDPHQFLRIHRSAVVNVDFVAELHARSATDYEAVLKDGSVLKLSRSFWRDLQELCDLLGVEEMKYSIPLHRQSHKNES